MHDQMPTVPMQSVRLGGGALGFAFPKSRFIFSGREETQTLEQNQKRKPPASTSGPSVRKRNMPPGVSRFFFRIFSRVFRGRRAKQLGALGESLQGAGCW